MPATNYGVVDPAQIPKAPSTMGLIDAAPPAQSAQIGTPTQWNITPDQTVAGQVKGLIDQYSPLMQQAEARGIAKANDRGLLSSSIAVGAGQSALYDAALPIAQQDASTNASANQFNANSANTIKTQQAQLDTNTNQFNTGQTNQVKTQEAANQTDLAKQNLQNQFAALGQNADAQTKTFLTQLQGSVQQNMANIEANYKTDMQVSQSASDMYRQTLSNISETLANPNMDMASKQNAVDIAIQGLQGFMATIGSVNGIPELGSLLSF